MKAGFISGFGGVGEGGRFAGGGAGNSHKLVMELQLKPLQHGYRGIPQAAPVLPHQLQPLPQSQWDRQPDWSLLKSAQS
jgi:hypothetical protein